MNYIKTSHILYYCLFGVFILFLFLSNQLPLEMLQENILLFYPILLIPLWDMLWDMMTLRDIGKMFFAAALGVFCFVVLYLVAGLQAKAESLSIWAYYLLLAGVMSEIIIALFFEKKSGNHLTS